MTRVVRRVAPVVDPSLVASTSRRCFVRQTRCSLTDFRPRIASAIGLFGLLLASMGTYRTVSYKVVLRAREVGVRMAMGAQGRTFPTHDERKRSSSLWRIAGRDG